MMINSFNVSFFKLAIILFRAVVELASLVLQRINNHSSFAAVGPLTMDVVGSMKSGLAGFEGSDLNLSLNLPGDLEREWEPFLKSIYRALKGSNVTK